MWWKVRHCTETCYIEQAVKTSRQRRCAYKSRYRKQCWGKNHVQTSSDPYQDLSKSTKCCWSWSTDFRNGRDWCPCAVRQPSRSRRCLGAHNRKVRVPKVVITDNGMQLGWVSDNNSPRTTHHKRIWHHTRESDRTVKTLIVQFAGKDQRNWDEKWPEIMLGVNTGTSSLRWSAKYATHIKRKNGPFTLSSLSNNKTSRRQTHQRTNNSYKRKD